MSDQDIDYIEAELKQTTVGYINKNWKVPPTGTHWANALARLESLRTGSTIKHGARTLPQGPFTNLNAMTINDVAAGGYVYSIHVSGNPDDGLRMQGYFGGPNSPPKPNTQPWEVADVISDKIGRTPPTGNGTKEFGLWFGCSRIQADRLLGHGTMGGMWLGCQCCDSTFTDVTLATLNSDGSLGKLPGYGLYIEHAARRVVIDGLTVSSAGQGVKAEWWYKAATYAAICQQEVGQYPLGGREGSWGIEIRNFDITSDTIGVNLEAGVFDYYLHDGVIRAPVGVRHPANLVVPQLPNRIDWSTIDFHGTTKELVHSDAIG